MINTKYVQFVNDGTPAQPVIVVDSIEGNGIVYPVREWDGVETISVVTPVIDISKPVKIINNAYIGSNGVINSTSSDYKILIFKISKKSTIYYTSSKSGVYATYKESPAIGSQSENKSRTSFNTGFVIESDDMYYLAVEYRTPTFKYKITFDKTVPCDNILLED